MNPAQHIPVEAILAEVYGSPVPFMRWLERQEAPPPGVFQLHSIHGLLRTYLEEAAPELRGRLQEVTDRYPPPHWVRYLCELSARTMHFYTIGYARRAVRDALAHYPQVTAGEEEGR